MRVQKYSVIPAKAGIQSGRRHWVPAFAGMTVLLLATAPASAQLPKSAPAPSPEAGRASGDAQSIIAVIDRMAVAMRAHDSATLTTLVVADGVIFSTDGAKVTRRTFAEWTAQIGASKSAIDERIGHPDIILSGPVASAVTPYALFIDGKLRYCGNNLFHFVRYPDAWKIAAITYDAKTEGCTQ